MPEFLIVLNDSELFEPLTGDPEKDLEVLKQTVQAFEYLIVADTYEEALEEALKIHNSEPPIIK